MSTEPASPITFAQAKAYCMPLGKYKGRELDEIAITDKGLAYLDWLRGECSPGLMRDHLNAYLDDPTIAKDLERIARERGE